MAYENLSGFTSPEQPSAPDSIFSAWKDFAGRVSAGMSTFDSPSYYIPGDAPDTDPFGIRSGSIAAAGTAPLTTNVVDKLRLLDGSTATREELWSTETGRSLVVAEEEIRRGQKYGFWESLAKGSMLDFVPFLNMFAKPGASLENGRLAESFFEKSVRGEAPTREETIAATLYDRENRQQADGTWGYKFGSVLRAAPAFVLEFTALGAAGQLGRSAKVASLAGSATEATAASMNRWGLTTAVKIGADETAEAAIRAFARTEMQATGRTLGEAVSVLAKNPELRAKTVDSVAQFTENLVKGAQNAIANPQAWAPGLATKVAHLRAEQSVASAISRMSESSLLRRSWMGLSKSVKDAVSQGFIDLGGWGTESSTVLTTGLASARKSALDAMTQLTFGATARGTAFYLPKAAVSQALVAPFGGAVGQNALQLKYAAWQNEDADLMNRADRYGMFLELMEYVSESTGRGFNSLGRAVGLGVAPKLMAPARRTAGLSHIVEAKVARDAAGAASGVDYVGLFEMGQQARVGGRIRQYLERKFGGTALREAVAEDRMTAAKMALKGLIRPADEIALQRTLSSGTVAAGLRREIAEKIGTDVNAFVKRSIREANRSGLERMKTKSFMRYYIADYLSRHNIDPLTAVDAFQRMGYDGVVGEMLEERYSDFVSNLWGWNAQKDQSWISRLRRAVYSAMYMDEEGHFSLGDMTVEAAAFAVPLLARAGTMAVLSKLGRPSRFARYRDAAGQLRDATRFPLVQQMRRGDYIVSLAEQDTRLAERAQEFQRRYDAEMESRGKNPTAPRASEADVKSWLAERDRLTVARRRLADIRRTFFDSIKDPVKQADDAIIAAPIVSDSTLTASEEDYNLKLHATEAQARGAISAYESLVDAAPEMAQTLDMMEERQGPGEDASRFRKVSHWIVTHALRLGGFAVTGDVAFLSVNPARFVGNDVGLPDGIQMKMKQFYHNAFEEALRERQEAAVAAVTGRETGTAEITPASQADYDEAHRIALERSAPVIRDFMTRALAAIQTRLFSNEELGDVAFAEVAREDGLAFDTKSREVVSPDGTHTSYDEYFQRDGVENRVETRRRELTRELYFTLSAGTGRDRVLETPADEAVRTIDDILTIPRDHPTYEAAVVARLARDVPALHDVQVAVEADGTKVADDVLSGMATRSEWIDAIANAVVPAGTEVPADAKGIEAALERIDNVDPAIVETVARDLNFHTDGTEESVRKRNRQIARLMLMASMASKDGTATFTRISTPEERMSRLASPFGKTAVARRTRDGWTITVDQKDGNVRTLRAPTLDALTEAVAADDFGYARVNPRLVFTSARVLRTDDALAMIRTLGFGSSYEAAMRRATDEQEKWDPILRTNEDGSPRYTEDEADRVREYERQAAAVYERHGKQNDPALYLEGDERASDDAALARAAVRMNNARRSWYARYARDAEKNGGAARGYAAVADEILKSAGVSVPFSGSNQFAAASQGLRGRYSISLRALRAVGASANVYLPINHGYAQDYESSVLDALLINAYAHGRSYLSRSFDTLIRGFLDDVDRIAADVGAESRRTGNDELASKIEDFRTSATRRRQNEVRRISPNTFAEFVSAFNLFRTEVPGARVNAVLGAHAAALKAIAGRVRGLTSYVGWSAAVDRMLGGDGFEVAAVTGEPSANGISRMYALFAPSESPTLKEAVEAAVPGGSFKAFAERATRNAWASATNAENADAAAYARSEAEREPLERGSRKSEAAERRAEVARKLKPVRKPAPVVPGPTAALRVAQDLVMAGNTPAETMEAVADGEKEIRATEGAGESGAPLAPVEPVPTPVPVSTTTEPPVRAEAPKPESNPNEFHGAAIERSDEDELDSYMHATSDEQEDSPVEVSDNGTRTVPADEKDLPDLSDDEVTAAVQTFAYMAAAVSPNATPDETAFTATVKRLVPGVRRVDMERLLEGFRALDTTELGNFAASWDWSEPADEEGIIPDGADGFVQRTAQMLKSKALTDFLAVMSMVSPTSGRDFQPFVEDLRSSVLASNWLDRESVDKPSEMSPELREAYGFLSRFVSPRSDLDAPDAAAREATWYNLLTWFNPGNPNREKVVAYAKTFLGTEGRPANARAAVLFSYLLSLSSKARNVRDQFASLIAGCAAAAPVELVKDGTNADGTPTFRIREYERHGKGVSYDMEVASFAPLAGKTVGEFKALAQSLEDGFKKFLDEGRFDSSKRLGGVRGEGVFNDYARLLAPVFGADSPIVSVLTSSPLLHYLASSEAAVSRKALVAGFYATNTDKYGRPQMPQAARILIETLRDIANFVGGGVKVNDGMKIPRALIDRAAVAVFQSGAPREASLTEQPYSLQTTTVWHRLFSTYDDAKPVSVMMARVDPERTRKPGSSLAITMAGIEPAVQQFMDRRGGNGFAAVVRKWFNQKGEAGLLQGEAFDRRMAVNRQNMTWPNAQATRIVAKSIDKTALSSEVLKGCERAYELEKKGTEATGNVYVPVFSGDHSSGIIIRVPLAKRFAEAGLSYMDIAKTVSKWVGLDLVGADAKRSAVTCVETPGTAMRSFAFDENGRIARDAEGKPVDEGHCYVAITWDSSAADRDGTDENVNESSIGSTFAAGYGVQRQKLMSKDPSTNLLKCHLSTVGEDPVYGAQLTLLKSLIYTDANIASYSGAAHVMRYVNSVVRGREDRDTCFATDQDSYKLGIANSKTFGVDDGTGKPTPLMKYFFEKVVRPVTEGKVVDPETGKPYELPSRIRGAELDRLVELATGGINWVNLGGEGGKRGRVKLSEILNGAILEEVPREAGTKEQTGKIYALRYIADTLEAFQVANVSHENTMARSRAPRNYVVDALAMTRVLADTHADTVTQDDAETIGDVYRNFVSAWAYVNSAIATDAQTIDAIVRDDATYRNLVDHGAPLDSPAVQNARRVAYAAWAKKTKFTFPFMNMSAALVTNNSWIGKDGRAHSHSNSRMFEDTLQGARVIGREDREFFGGVKRVGIANVNCASRSFRYGLYVDEGLLEQKFGKYVGGDETGFRRTVLILETVLNTIRRNERNLRIGATFADRDGVNWRKALADCLIDHHGNAFSKAHRTIREAKRDENGNVVRDESGNIVKVPVERYAWEEVSYLDLFGGVEGNTFDRTAIYESMYNDAKRRTYAYIGGTKLGLPRTPSYNGSMWLQVVRAGLPVSETVNEDGSWEVGHDNVVAPDPFTLKILGCDHDGDKTNLYCLDGALQNNPDPFTAVHELAEIVDACRAEYDGPERLLRILAERRFVTRKQHRDEHGNLIDDGLEVSNVEMRRACNTFVHCLFEMNRMLPVDANAKAGDTVFAGFTADERNAGSVFRGTKARLTATSEEGAAPAGAWDTGLVNDGEKTGALGPKLLDAKNGKILVNPTVATAVQDSAALIADARARVVSLASALHFAYASGGDFALGRLVTAGGPEWLDFIYHVDGLSNMTFDDIKEQICSRLGIRPNMIPIIVADLIRSAPSGLPRTDAQFLAAFADYAKRANGPEDWMHYLGRASDPTDYAFRRIVTDKVKTGTQFDEGHWTSVDFKGTKVPPKFDREKPPAEGTVARLVWEYVRAVTDGEIEGRLGASSVEGVELDGYATLVRNLRRAADNFKAYENGFSVWAAEHAGKKDAATLRKAGEFFGLMRLTEDVERCSAFARSVNWMGVDPAAPDEHAVAKRFVRDFNGRPFTGPQSESLKLGKRENIEVGSAGTAKVPSFLVRLYDAAGMAYDGDRGIGRLEMAYANGCAENFRTIRRDVVNGFGGSLRTENADPTPNAIIAACSYVVPAVDVTKPFAALDNLRTIPWMTAAINTMPTMSKSKITPLNAYGFLRDLGRAIGEVRHPKMGDANTVLDVRYAIETMLDFVGRLVRNSTAHLGLNVFDFIAERSDAGWTGYTPDTYGAAASGLSRIVPAFTRMTERQRSTARRLVESVIAGALDSDGAYVRKGYRKLRFKVDERRPEVTHTVSGLSFTLSLKNLEKAREEIFLRFGAKKDIVTRRSEDYTKRHGRQMEAGSARNMVETVDQLIAVFKELGKKYGEDFAIEPSALFGQLLPVYAAMTGRIDGPAGTGGQTILEIFPESTYRRLANEVSRTMDDYRLLDINRLLIATNFSPVRSVDLVLDDETGRTTRVRRKFKPSKASEEDLLKAIPLISKYARDAYEADGNGKWSSGLDFTRAARKALVGSKFEYAIPTTADGVEPGTRITVSAFDGPRGLLFEQYLAACRGDLNTGVHAPQRSLADRAAEEAAVVSTETRESAQPEDVKVYEDVAEVADRLSVIMKMWDLGTVEYTGGRTIRVKGRLHSREKDAVDMNLEFTVAREGDAVLTDEEIRRTMRRETTLQSLSEASHVPVDELKTKTDNELIGLIHQHQPVGATSFRSEGTVGARSVAGLLGRIRLESGHGKSAVYHEFFHGVMGFLRHANFLTNEEVAGLVKAYGEHGQFGAKWFNEEKAAEDFRKFVEGKLEAKAKPRGVFAKIRAFLESLFNILFDGTFGPGDYSRPMEENPLAAIVLTGRVPDPVRREMPKTLDFTGKLASAVSVLAQQKGLENTTDFMRSKDLAAREGDVTLLDWAHTLEGTILTQFDIYDADDPDLPSLCSQLSLVIDEASVADSPDEGLPSSIYTTLNGQVDAGIIAGFEDFMKEYFPKDSAEPATEAEAAVAKVSTATTGTVRNPIHDSPSMAADIPTTRKGDADGERRLGQGDLFAGLMTKSAEGGDLTDVEYALLVNAGLLEESFMMATSDDLARNLKAAGVPDYATRPLAREHVVARAIAAAFRDGLRKDSETYRILRNASRSALDAATEATKAKLRNTAERIAAIYGRPVTSDKDMRNLMFSAMLELGKALRPDPSDKSFRHSTDTSSAVIAGAVAAVGGVRPVDLAESCLADIDRVMEKYPEGNSLRGVLTGIRAAVERVAESDPTRLAFDNAYLENRVGDAIASVRSGLVGGGYGADGRPRDFRLIDRTKKDRNGNVVETTANAYSKANLIAYTDHIANPDFQSVLHGTLDALYTVAASMRFYREIGFEPGRAEDEAKARALAPDAPPPISPVAMAASVSVAPEQLMRGGTAVDFFDQPFFVAENADAWLDSVTRPNYGRTGLREMALEEKRRLAAFHNRISSQNVFDARLYGLDLIPGQALTAIETDYSADFEMEAGRIVHRKKEGRKEHIRFKAYEGQKAKDANGREIVMDLTDVRRTDFLIKARCVWAVGGRKVLTGVDGIVFSPEDVADPSHYEWSKVVERSRKGRAYGYSPIDTALVRLHRQYSDDSSQPWTDIVGGGLNVDERFVKAACDALTEAKKRLNETDEQGVPRLTAARFNDWVLRRLSREGVLEFEEHYVPGSNEHTATTGTLCVDVDEYEKFYLASSTYRKLLDGGRKAEWLSRDRYVADNMGIWKEFSRFIGEHPYLTDGDGAFFHNAATTIPFVRGSGVFMYGANRRAIEEAGLAKATELRGRFEEAFIALADKAGVPIAQADASTILLFRDLFHTREQDVEAIRAAIVRGDYAEHIAGNASLRDLGEVIYNRLVGMSWEAEGDRDVKNFGGRGAVGRMVRAWQRRSAEHDSIVRGNVGMTPEMVFRMTGILPANHQLGHAIQNAIDGVSNAFAFRATLYNMLTTPAEDGMPTCYARPADDAPHTGGITDELWGSVARWWASANGLEYDVTKSGVKNAQEIYDRVVEQMRGGKIAGAKFGTIDRKDIDAPSITGFIARSGTPEEESKLGNVAGGYALGYAKHLLQSTRGMGNAWQRAVIHRAWAWSKGLSVSFSYFFPLATRFESPMGAVGSLATFGGNASPEFVRQHAKTFAALQKAFTLGKETPWIDGNFIGEKDVFKMLDSNDPFIAELRHWAGLIGLGLSDANANPQERSRGILQEDLKNAVRAAKSAFGDTTAARVDEILRAVFTRAGDRAFTYHLNATKLAVAAQMLTKFQAEAARRGIAFDPVRDLKRYSNYINAEVGGIDPLTTAWMHPKARNWMNMLFFSWEWTRGAWEAGGGTALEQMVFGGHDITREERHYFLGRATRMLTEVMLGVPLVMQIAVKLIAVAMTSALLPPDDELTDEQREMLRKIRESPWFTWQNEDKTWLTAYNVTPLMRAVALCFPSFKSYATNHPFLYSLPVVAAGVLGKPWLMAGTLPVYTGGDVGNQKTMGREYYQHFGKQGWEFLRWFTDGTKQFFGKLSMPVQRLLEGILGRSVTNLDHPLPWDDQGDVERWFNPSWDSAWFNLLRAFVPFSVSSLSDSGDAGFLPILAPVQMGTSASDSIERIESELGKWAEHDRLGLTSGKPTRTSRGQKFGKRVAWTRPAVAHIVREAMLNGFSEKDAYGLVDAAARRMLSKHYSNLLKQLPKEPDGDFDAKALGKTLRILNRLGRFRKDVYEKGVVPRLEEQGRWNSTPVELRRRWRQLIREGMKHPYSPLDNVPLDTDGGIGYDY